MVSVALVWGWLYDPSAGILNWLLAQAHLIEKPIPWLYDKNTALWAVMSEVIPLSRRAARRRAIRAAEERDWADWEEGRRS